MTTQNFYPRSSDGCISPDGSLTTQALLKVYGLVKSAKFFAPTSLNLEVIERSLYEALGLDGRMQGGFFALSLKQSVFHPRSELSDLLGVRHHISLRFLSSSEVRAFGGEQMLLGEAEARLPSGRVVVHRLFLPALAVRAEDLMEFERRCMSLATFAVLGLLPIAEGIPMAPLRTDAIVELARQHEGVCSDWHEENNKTLYQISLECEANKDLYAERLLDLEFGEEELVPGRKLLWETAKRDLASTCGSGDYFDELLRKKHGNTVPSSSAMPTPESPPEAVSPSEASDEPSVLLAELEAAESTVEPLAESPAEPVVESPAAENRALLAEEGPLREDAEYLLATETSARSFEEIVREQSDWAIGLIRESGSAEDARKASGLLPVAASAMDRRRARSALRAKLLALSPPKDKKSGAESTNAEPSTSDEPVLTEGELGRYELPGDSMAVHWWNHLLEKEKLSLTAKDDGGGVAGAYAKRHKAFKLTGVDDTRLMQTVRMVAEIRGHGELEAVTFVRDIVKRSAKFEGPKLARNPWKSSAE